MYRRASAELGTATRRLGCTMTARELCILVSKRRADGVIWNNSLQNVVRPQDASVHVALTVEKSPCHAKKT